MADFYGETFKEAHLVIGVLWKFQQSIRLLGDILNLGRHQLIRISRFCFQSDLEAHTVRG